MSKLSVEAKVGFFVVIGIIILSYMSMKIGNLSLERSRGYDIWVYFDSATGLARDISVEIAGVQVGSVSDIRLENNKARVGLKIDANVKLGRDVKAVIRTRGILGDKYIELIPGSLSAPPIQPGGRILRSVSPTDMDTLMTVLGNVAKDINKLTTSFSNVLGGKKGEASLHSIVDNLRQMVETLNTTVQGNNENIRKIISNLSDFSESLKKITDTNTDDVEIIISNLSRASGKLEKLLGQVSDITQKINTGKGSIGKLVNENKTVDSLNGALASLKKITDKINSGEGSMGRLINEDKTVENINSTFTGINDYIRKQETFRTYLSYRGEYLFDDNTVKSYLSLRIQPKEDKYYLLQIVDDPVGKRKVTDTVTTTNGNPVTEHREEMNKNKLKFSAQIAKRYYDLGLRGGLFESTGGLGLDYYFLNDHLILSVEAFDFDPDRNTHLKFKADFTPFQHLYISSGFDDFISDEGKKSFFIGAGISFADEDIKTLITNLPIPGQ